MSLTRRELFYGAAVPLARAAAAGAPRISRLEIFPVVYPVKGYFKFFTKPERQAVFVKITCDDGTAGWGESVPMPTWSYETVESVASVLQKYLAPILTGRDPTDIAGAHAAMNRAIAPSFSTGMPICKAGVDLALHDITGKLASKSMPELWNRKPLARVTLSWTVNTTSLQEVDALVEQGWKLGYRNFNVKVSPDPKFDVEMCKRVRKLAPDGFLWADANGGYDLATALAVAPRLAAAGVNVLEQPVAANRLTAFREIRKQGALPIILDEGVVNSVELAEYIRLGLCDGVAMKPARTAGLWDARKQIELLEKEGLMFLGSGITDPDIALTAAVQLYAAYNLKYPAALNGPQFLNGSYLRKPLVVKDGAIEVPGGPGLGVQVNEAALLRATRPVSVAAPSVYSFKDDGSTSLTLLRDGAPVYTYNYGMMLKEGAPPERRRSSYLHAVYAANGVVLTDDFPRDHYHHRGISWMWPLVEAGGTQYDQWMVKGIHTRFVRWTARDAAAGWARLGAENGWFLDDGRKIVTELVDIVSDGGGMALTLVFTALEPVQLRGTHEANKGYGGLSFRFAPRKDTVIRTDSGIEAKDTDMAPHRWAELEGSFENGRAAARVDIDPSHPGFPNGWCLRHYGFLGVNYPGLQPIALEPGKPLTLKYRITLSSR